MSMWDQAPSSDKEANVSPSSPQIACEGLTVLDADVENRVVEHRVGRVVVLLELVGNVALGTVSKCRLSTFRKKRTWTKTSPGRRPRTVVSGTRESEQPNQTTGGFWACASVGRNSGSAAAVVAAHSWLPAK